MCQTMRIAILCAVVAVVCLGCQGADQNDVIGEGPAALVFTNDGNPDIEVKVSWQGEDGQWQAKDFTVESSGRVELRLLERQKYFVALEGDETVCPPAAVERTPARPAQVITLDRGTPCGPPAAARR